MLKRLVLKRSLFAIFQIFGASITVFVIVRLLPGDPATLILGETAGPEQVKALQHSLGLDRPIPEQYVIWMRHVLHGDLGRSLFTSNAVIQDIKERLPVTLELVTGAMLISIFVLIPIGVLTARRVSGWHRAVADKAVFTYGMLAGSLPDFWLALLLVYFLYFKLKIFPAPSGRFDITVIPPPRVTGFNLIDSAIAGDWTALSSYVKHLALPVMTLAFVYGAPILKMTRQTVITMLEAEFVEQARATGLSNRTLLRIAFKNSLPPIITLIGLTYSYTIGGAVLVETVFSWGGMGQYAVQGILNADYSAIQGFVIVAALSAIIVFLLVDILYYLIDPRVAA
jgi:ABC-type dipeptide/oligopeptide/nickel transport system permease component